MAECLLPSPRDFRQLLRYEPETGKLFWKERSARWFAAGKLSPEAKARRWNARFAGKEGFTGDNGSGYRFGTVNGQKYYAHRVIMAMIDGEWPQNQVDHKNGDRADNRLANLRHATSSQNGANMKLSPNSTSGVKGVYWFSPAKLWVAKTKVNGKQIYLGYFKNKEDAARAYAEGARRYHGEFARLA